MDRPLKRQLLNVNIKRFTAYLIRSAPWTSARLCPTSRAPQGARLLIWADSILNLLRSLKQFIGKVHGQRCIGSSSDMEII